MSVGQLVVQLDLNGTEFTTKLSVARADLRRFAQDIGLADSALKRNAASARSWGGALRDSVVILALFRNAIQNVNDTLLALPRAIITANAQMERMRTLMANLSTSSGSFAAQLEEADRNIAGVFDIAKRSAFNVQTITDAFVKLKSGGIDPTQGALQALIDGVAKFGGDSQILHRASIAIQQMGGKGVISMEELRQQLGEAIPDAVQVMARAAGMTMADFVKKVASGTVEASSALQNFFRQLQLESAGNAEAMAGTWVGMMNRLSTRFTEFAVAVGNEGFFDEVREQLEFLVDDILTSPALLNVARDFGEAMTTGLEAIRTFADVAAPALRTLYDNIGEVAAALVLLKLNFMRLQSLKEGGRMAELVQAWAAYRAEISATRGALLMTVPAAQATRTGVQGLASVFAIAQVSAGRLAAGITALGKSMYAFVGGPIGVIVLALWGLYEVYDKVIASHDRFIRKLRDNNGMAETAEDIDKLTRMLRDLEKQRVKEINEAKFDAQDFRGTKPSTIARIEAIKQRYESEIRAMQYSIDKSLSAQIEDRAQSLYHNLTRSLQSELRQAGQLVRDAGRKAQEEASKLGTEEERTDYIRKMQEEAERQSREKVRQIWATALERESADLDALKKQAERKDATASDKIAYRARLEQLKLIQDELKKVTEGTDLMDRVQQKFVSMSGSGAPKRSKLEEYLDNIRVRIEDTKAALEGSGQELAKVNERIRAGTFKGSQKDIDEARRLAAAYDEQVAALKRVTEARQTLSTLTDRARDLEQTANRRFAVAENENRFAAAAASMVAYRDQAKKMAREIEDLMSKGLVPDEKLEEARKAYESLIESAATFEKAGTEAAFKKAREELREYTLEQMSARDKAVAAIRIQRDEWQDYISKLQEVSPEMQVIIDRYNQMLDQMQRDSEGGLQRLLKDWKKNAVTLDDVWAKAMEGMADVMTDFIVDGKASFGDFLEDLAKMIVKSQIQQMFAEMFLQAGIGLSPAPSKTTVTPNSAGSVTSHATGGVMTSKGPLTLRKYANGGIAYHPQVALFGEGSTPEAYVPLPDGRSIPVTLDVKDGGKSSRAVDDVNVQINLINQAGQPVQAEQGGQRFDGERYIVDVVLKNLSRPGPMRDAVRSV